jgi:hypothetical protein
MGKTQGPYNKTNKRIIKNVNLGLQRTGVPNSLSIKLPYLQLFNFASSGNNHQVFAANGCYDPDITGTGLQPLGFDEWSSFYKRYLVEHCSIEIEATNNAALPCTLCLYPSGVVTGLSDIEDSLAQYGAAWRRLGGNGAQNRATLKMDFNTKNWLGYKSIVSTLYAAVTSNPDLLGYFHINAENFGGTTLDLYLTVKLVYSIRFFDPQQLSLSTGNTRFTLTDEGKKYQDEELEKRRLVSEQARLSNQFLDQMNTPPSDLGG